METLGKFLNNRPSSFPPPDYEDEGSRQYSEVKEEVDYKILNSQEEHTSTQPNDNSEVAHHEQKAQTETSQEVEMEEYPIQQENHSFLQLCMRPFPSNQSSVFRGRHSWFHQKHQVSSRESPPTWHHGSDNETAGISQRGCSAAVSVREYLQAAL